METSPPQHAAIDAGVGALDHGDVEVLAVEIDRPDAADDGVGVAGLAHAAEGGEEEGLADALCRAKTSGDHAPDAALDPFGAMAQPTLYAVAPEPLP